MDEQRVPNLEEMDEQQAEHFLIQLYSDLSPEEEYNVHHQDYVMEMPQSGERFRGRENMRAFQRARSDHSTPPRSLQLRRGGHRLRRWAGIRRGADLRAARREDVAGQMVLRRAV
jgi:hypothetical protein